MNYKLYNGSLIIIRFIILLKRSLRWYYSKKLSLPINGSMRPYLIMSGNVGIRADTFFTGSIVSTSISLKTHNKTFK